MSDKLFTAVTTSRQNADYSGWKEIAYEFDEIQCRQWRLLWRLHDNRVADSERGRGMLRREQKWMIVSVDAHNHAQWLPDGIIQIVAPDWDRCPLHFCDQSSKKFKGESGRLDVACDSAI